MTNPSTLPDPDPQRYQRVLEHLANVRAHGFPQAPVLTPALRFSEWGASQWIPSHAPAQPQPKAAPEQGTHYPQATPFQLLTLEGLNNDVLAIVIDFMCESQTSDVKYRNEGYGLQKTRFDYRMEGSSLFCLSLVSKRMRAIVIPKLFTHVSRVASSMGDLNRRLRDIEGNPLIPSLPLVLPAIKTCDIVATSPGKKTFCRTRLAKTLPKMESLAELSVTHRKDVDTSGLRATFQRHQITLSSIVRLRILSHGSWSFLVEACPNVEILALEYNLDQDDMMHAAGALKHLTDFEICRDTWRKKDIQRLLQFLPEIQSLALRGTLGQEKLSTFAEVFGLFPKLAEIAITAIQEVTDEDLEGEYSDDGSGYGSIYGEMMWEHELDEDQSSVAMKLFGYCPVLETLCLVRTGWVTSWYPTRGSKGSLESVYSPRDGYTSWHQSDELGIREHDKEGFPKLFTFPRPTNFCSEAWDHQSNWSESSESMEYWRKERDRYYAIKDEALQLGLWEGGSRLYDLY